ncbi:MAG: HEPN domain-containing protein [Pseudonocardia sp.]|nr:HEPN domain-containing protein [Pseudonocardia sp.]
MNAARPDVAGLLRAGRLQQVPADPGTARARLTVAEQHLDTAGRLLAEDLDLEIAYVALYDAARKAVTAAMLAAGVRATHRGGAHEAVAIWCAQTLGPRSAAAKKFDALRRRRNRSEYDDLVLSGTDVTIDLADANEIVNAAAAIARDLIAPQRPPLPASRGLGARESGSGRAGVGV